MEAALGALVLIVGLLASVALHELGHMVPAKAFGVRVSQFFVGFGRTIWSFKRGETEYGFKWLPLGGFVRIQGMVPPESKVKPVRARGWIKDVIDDARAASVAEMGEDDSRAFYRLEWWRKVIVMAGGPVMNLIIAIALFTVVTSGIGTLSQTLQVAVVSDCVSSRDDGACVTSDPASPASIAGIEPGDVFVSVDGKSVSRWTDVTAIISSNPGKELEFVVLRDGEELTLTATPAERERPTAADPGVTETVGFLGITSQLERERQPLSTGVTSALEGAVQTAAVVVRLPVEVYHVGLAALGLEERSDTSVMGIIGVGRTAGEVASADVAGYTLIDRVADMLMLLGGLNLALFVFNMIPLTPLDGGHIVSAVWQGIKNGYARLRKASQPYAVDVARQIPLAYVVFGILILMSVVLALADIVAPVRLT